MNYFKLLGLIFGTIALLKPVYIHLLPYDENKLLAKAYKKERPKWIVPIAIFGLLLVGFTWYKHFTTEIDYSIVLAIMFSLTAIKGLVLLFDYQKFYEWVAGMLKNGQGRKIVLVDIGASIFGLAMIVLTWIFY